MAVKMYGAVLAVALAFCLCGALASCKTFHTGLCPGSSSCLCTTSDTCAAEGADTNLTAWQEGQLGGCPGSCRSIVHDQCPGSSSCLADTGSCSGGGGGGCLGPAGSPCACTGRPASGNYFLTSFDGTSCSCGACHQYGDYFSADRQRFGCGASLNVCRGGKCVKTRVTDYGPSCFVEDNAGGPVLDSSPAVCKALTGGSSCGWSDHFTVHVSVTLSPEEDGIPYGPFPVTPEEYAKIVALGEKLDLDSNAALVKGV